jgi:hypothetical protein
MAQIVISFGSDDLGSVAAAVKLSIAESEYTVSETTARRVMEMEFTPTGDNLDSITERLYSGELTSACLNLAIPEPIDFIHIFAPNFCGSSLSLWQGVIEYRALAFESLFHRLLEINGLQYVCAGMEEGPELEDRHMSLTTFPFGDWPMIVSAFRRDENPEAGWEQRPGPGAD